MKNRGMVGLLNGWMAGLLNGCIVRLFDRCIVEWLNRLHCITIKPPNPQPSNNQTIQQSNHHPNHQTIQQSSNPTTHPISSSRAASTIRPCFFPSGQTASTCRSEVLTNNRSAKHNGHRGGTIHPLSIHNPGPVAQASHTQEAQAFQPQLPQ